MKRIIFVLLPFLLIIVSFLGLRDKFIFPYIDHLRLGSEAYEKEIEERAVKEEAVKGPVVWRSKTLEVQPPKINIEKELAKKVLAADPNTWIDINLSTQTLCLFHGGGTNCFSVSTGMPWTPTPAGTFYIWIKLPSTTMSGPGYYLPGVPWTMYFYRGYGIHGTYWHNNFGHPMSHGCVNMRTPEAGFVYERVSVGTRVVVHY